MTLSYPPFLYPTTGDHDHDPGDKPNPSRYAMLGTLKFHLSFNHRSRCRLPALSLDLSPLPPVLYVLARAGCLPGPFFRERDSPRLPSSFCRDVSRPVPPLSSTDRVRLYLCLSRVALPGTADPGRTREDIVQMSMRVWGVLPYDRRCACARLVAHMCILLYVGRCGGCWTARSRLSRSSCG
jgi:hypothetical protein